MYYRCLTKMSTKPTPVGRLWFVFVSVQILSWANVVATHVSATFNMQLYIWLQSIINTCSINSHYFNLRIKVNFHSPPLSLKIFHRWSNTMLWFKNKKKNVNTSALHLYLPQITSICPWSCHLTSVKIVLIYCICVIYFLQKAIDGIILFTQYFALGSSDKRGVHTKGKFKCNLDVLN